MLEILQFIFSDFWHWLGTYMMLGLITGGFTNLIAFINARTARQQAKHPDYD